MSNPEGNSNKIVLKYLITLVGLLIPCQVLSHEFILSKEIYNHAKFEFLGNSGPEQLNNNIMMVLPFEPMAELFKQLLLFKRTQLINRGEAHITVLTPEEYWNSLKEKLSIEEITNIAKDEKINNLKFKIICLGVGEAILNKKKEETFYLVVKSDSLMSLRAKIHKAYVKKGGEPTRFEPYKYYPHITLGFTKRDLHANDGVTKDIKSCPSNLKVTLVPG